MTDGTNIVLPVSNVEALIGGKGHNRFVFEDGATFNGTITGGPEGSTNTLDYSAYSNGVAVDLSAGTATGTAGISGIQNVVGGAGHDVITGDASDNVLAGGAGNDTIAGGDGVGILFKKGRVIKKFPQERLCQVLLDAVGELAAAQQSTEKR